MVTNNRVRTARRQAKWVEFAPTNHTITAGGQATQDLLLNLDGGTKGLTIVRTILTMQMFANSSEATGDMIRLDYGLALVDVEAALAGAYPDPGFPDQVAWLHSVLLSSGPPTPAAEQQPCGYSPGDSTLSTFLDLSCHTPSRLPSTQGGRDLFPPAPSPLY